MAYQPQATAVANPYRPAPLPQSARLGAAAAPEASALTPTPQDVTPAAPASGRSTGWGPAMPSYCPAPTAAPYAEGQQILLVGEGNFSFAKALAATLSDSSGIVATALDPQATVEDKYGESALSQVPRWGHLQPPSPPTAPLTE